MYRLLLDGVQYPVPPSKVEIKANGNNKTVDLVDGTELNLLQSPGLSDVNMTILLPGVRYSFATYTGGFQPPKHYLGKLEALMVGKRPFRFELRRELDGGARLHDTSMVVSLENYTITDDANEGIDTTVKLSLKQYVYPQTGLAEVKEDGAGGLVAVPKTARANNRSTPESYTAQAGDTLLGIAKMFLGSDALYPSLAAKNGISNPCKLAAGMVIRL